MTPCDDVKLDSAPSSPVAGSEHSWEDLAETVVYTSGFTTYHKGHSWFEKYTITLSNLEKY